MMDELDYRILKILSITGGKGYKKMKRETMFPTEEFLSSVVHLKKQGYIQKEGWGGEFTVTEKGQEVLE